MVNINLLPWREVARERKKRILINALFLVIFLTLILVYCVFAIISQMLDKQYERNTYLETEIVHLNNKIAEINNIKDHQNRIKSRIAIIVNLQQVRNLPTRVLDELARIVPAEVNLSRIEKQHQVLKIEGHSDSNSYIANMMRKMKASSWLTNPYLHSIAAKSVNNGTQLFFNLTVEIVDLPLLSSTYTQSN